MYTRIGVETQRPCAVSYETVLPMRRIRPPAAGKFMACARSYSFDSHHFKLIASSGVGSFGGAHRRGG
jgi:hypothetical protein